MNFRTEVEIMSDNFRRNAGKIKLPPRPRWLRDEDELSRFYTEFPKLMLRGELFYACLVQANKCLFEPPRGDLTPSVAEIIFNHKRPEQTLANPLLMQNFAHYLFECREKDDGEIPQWIQAAVNVISGELDRSRVVIKSGDEDDFEMNVTMQSVLVFRENIPNGVLDGRILPIIAAPAECDTVMILPSKYWSRGFIHGYWSHADDF